MFSSSPLISNIFHQKNTLYPKYKSTHSFDQRFEESQRIMNKYPDRIPIICESLKPSNPQIDKTKYLVPNDLTIGQFLYVIRKRIALPPEQAIYLFVNGSIPATSELIAVVYDRNKDVDGFLYIYYSCENTFGAWNP